MGYYETPNFTIVERDVVSKPPPFGASKIKSSYYANVLIVNRWEPQLRVKDKRNIFIGKMQGYFRAVI